MAEMHVKSPRILTATFVSKLKHEAGEVADLQCPGLRIVPLPSGVKTWVVRLKTPDGKQQRVKLARYPTMGLKEAQPGWVRRSCAT